MAQISIFDKKQHRSNKDVTISVGQKGIIYITFRNESWLRITASDFIRVWIENKKLKFGDGLRCKKGRKFKLVINSKNKNAEAYRYIKITGRAMPEVLEIAEKSAGSYNLPPIDTAPERDPVKADLADFTNMCIKKHGGERITSEGLAEKFKPQIAQLRAEPDPGYKTIRNQFMDDALALCQTATSTEERTAIYNALAAVYGAIPADPGPVLLAKVKKAIAEAPDEDLEKKFEI